MAWVLANPVQFHVLNTLPETNIAPENRPSQKETSLPIIHFQVRAVSFRECIFTKPPNTWQFCVDGDFFLRGWWVKTHVVTWTQRLWTWPTQRLGDKKITSPWIQIGSMVVSGSPKRWDRWHFWSPNWQEKYHLYTTYSPCRTWGVKNATFFPPFRGTISTTIFRGSTQIHIKTHYIRCIWGWLLRVPSQGYHNFPNENWIRKNPGGWKWWQHGQRGGQKPRVLGPQHVANRKGNGTPENFREIDRWRWNIMNHLARKTTDNNKKRQKKTIGTADKKKSVNVAGSFEN